MKYLKRKHLRQRLKLVVGVLVVFKKALNENIIYSRE